MGPERKIEPEQTAARRDVVAQFEEVLVEQPLRVRVHLDSGPVEEWESIRPTPPIATIEVAHGAKPCVVDRERVLPQEVVESGAAAGRYRLDLFAQRVVHARECRGVVDQRRGCRQGLEVVHSEVQFVPKEAADGRIRAGDVGKGCEQGQGQDGVAAVVVHPVEELAQRGEIADVVASRRRQRIRRRVHTAVAPTDRSGAPWRADDQRLVGPVVADRQLAR